MCAYFKNPTGYADKLFQKFKVRAKSWNLFFVTNMEKTVPLPPKKMVFFFKSTKTDNTVLKFMSI